MLRMPGEECGFWVERIHHGVARSVDSSAFEHRDSAITALGADN
jgi:hypothetical protein